MPPQKENDSSLLEPIAVSKDGSESETSSPAPKDPSTRADKSKHVALDLPADHPSKAGWWRCGGMHINLNGMGINIYGALYLLLRVLPEEQIKMYTAFFLGCVACSALVGMRTMYCILILPTFMTSLVLCFTLDMNNLFDTSVVANIPVLQHLAHPATLFVISLALSITKINICMSVCLHRYAAHNAFKCGPVTSFFINALGCCAIQGGPIWWSSMHRCHHRHCEGPRDPHSPTISGIEKAFAFFELHQEVEEEFVPRHVEGPFNRFLDTWSWVVVWCELALAHHFFGLEGLFISFTSGWLCQSVTLWFNISNHPPQAVVLDKNGVQMECKASNADMKVFGRPKVWYLPIHVLDTLFPIYATFIMEGEHKHHHDNAMLAKRSSYDPAYWFFVKPLELAGLVWDVQCGEY